MDCFRPSSQLICGKLRSLLPHAERLVQRRDGAPIQIAFRIETPISRNENHRSKWSQIRRQLEKQRTIPAHSIQMPALTKHIEHRVKTVCCFGPANRPVVTHTALRDESAASNSFVIRKLRDIEARFNRVPLCLELWIVGELRFDLIVFVASAE